MTWSLKLKDVQDELNYWSPPPVQVGQLLRTEDILLWTVGLVSYSRQGLTIQQVQSLLQGRDEGSPDALLKARVSNAYALFAQAENGYSSLSSSRLGRWHITWGRNVWTESGKFRQDNGDNVQTTEQMVNDLVAKHQTNQVSSTESAAIDLAKPLDDAVSFLLEFINLAPFCEENLVMGMVGFSCLLRQNNYPWLIIPWTDQFRGYLDQARLCYQREMDDQAVVELTEFLAQALFERMAAQLTLIKAQAGSGQCGVGGPKTISIM